MCCTKRNVALTLLLLFNSCFLSAETTSRIFQPLSKTLYPYDSQAFEGKPIIFGVAKNWHSDDIEYFEVFYESERGLRTLFINAEGQVFAERWLKTLDQAAAPLFQLRDFRHGSTWGVKAKNGTLYQFHQEGPEDPYDDAPIDSNRIVIDAGFNEYIKQYWPTLFNAQETVKFEFAFPKRFMELRMKLKAVSCEDIDLPNAPSQLACLELKLRNPILSLIAGITTIQYNSATQQLVGFQGLSNIASAERKPLKARIRYYHTDILARMQNYKLWNQ